MKNFTVISVIYGRSFANLITDFLRKIGLIKVAYGVPIFDEHCRNEIGCIATVTCRNKFVRNLIEKMYNKERVSFEPLALEKKPFDVI